MATFEHRVAKTMTDIDFYCGENTASIKANEVPGFIPTEFARMEDDGIQLAHCSVIEIYRRRITDLRAEAARLDERNTTVLSRLFWGDRLLTNFAQVIGDSMLPKKPVFIALMSVKHLEFGSALSVITDTTHVCYIRSRDDLFMLFDGIVPDNYVDADLLDILTSLTLSSPDDDGAFYAVELCFNLLTGGCTWRKRCFTGITDEIVARPVFKITGREDIDARVWISFVRARRRDHKTTALNIFDSIPNARSVRWENTVTRIEWRIVDTTVTETPRKRLNPSSEPTDE